MQQWERSGTTVSHCVLDVLKQQVIPVPQFVVYFLPPIIKYLKNEDEGVATMWSSTLIGAIPLLPTEDLQTHITPVAYQTSSPAQPLHKRIISCKVIGALALQYDSATVKKDLLPVCLSLCQDEHHDVRAAICLELEKVITRLKGECFETTLGPSLIELGSDKVDKVKEAAFATAVNILYVVDEGEIASTLLPLLIRMIEYGLSSVDQLLLCSISSRFGDMCLGIKNVAEDKKRIVKYFSSLAQAGLPQSQKTIALNCDLQESQFVLTDLKLCYRESAAANLPSVLTFCEDDEELIEEVLRLFHSLCSDPSVSVRRAVATGMVEIARFAQQRKYFVQRNLISLLNDDDEEVLEAVVPLLSNLIAILIQSEEFSVLELSDGFTLLNDFFLALLKCESLISSSRNWRLYCHYLRNLKSLASVLPPKILYTDYVCLLLKRMHQTRIVPTRASLMETVLYLLRRLPNHEEKSKAIEVIVQEFCRSTNFYNRIFYLRSCAIIFELYSVAYFKKYFFSPTLSLVDDAVPNIRMFLVKLYPKLCYVTTHPFDEDLSKKLESVKEKLLNDKDKEISNEMNSSSLMSEESDLNCFTNDKDKFEEEVKWGEYKIVELSNCKSAAVSGSRIPRSPSSNSSLGLTSNKAVLRRKTVENQQSKLGSTSTLKENEAVNKSGCEESEGHNVKCVRRSFGFAQLPKSHSSPNSRQNSFKDKRLSLDEIDLNKSVVLEEKGDLSQSSPLKPSQLPRPLSCINFSSPSSFVEKKSNFSKLPVSSRSCSGARGTK